MRLPCICELAYAWGNELIYGNHARALETGGDATLRGQTRVGVQRCCAISIFAVETRQNQIFKTDITIMDNHWTYVERETVHGKMLHNIGSI